MTRAAMVPMNSRRRLGFSSGAHYRVARGDSPPRGVGAPEVLVVLALLFLLVTIALFALPRRRETARRGACQRNLMQIGVALALYERAEGSLPTVPRLGTEPMPYGCPLKSLLEALVLPDLTELSSNPKLPSRRPGVVAGERPVPGFVCPSDRSEASRVGFPAPVSYRATTGDSPGGSNGGFAPGRRTNLSDIEAGDGRGFTAAFSERLLGTYQDGDRNPANYLIVPGAVVGRSCLDAGSGTWRGDAGWSWAEASWRSTLYSHALTPGAAPSCVSQDARTALMGASSGHPAGVNVLMFDGSVRVVTSTVAPQVWYALATVVGTPPAPQKIETAPDKPVLTPKSQ